MIKTVKPVLTKILQNKKKPYENRFSSFGYYPGMNPSPIISLRGHTTAGLY